MKELIELYGWEHYQSGCLCQGLPKYYRNNDHPEYKIIIKGKYGKLRKGGRELFKTSDLEEFKQKLKEYEIIAED